MATGYVTCLLFGCPENAKNLKFIPFSVFKNPITRAVKVFIFYFINKLRIFFLFVFGFVLMGKWARGSATSSHFYLRPTSTLRWENKVGIDCWIFTASLHLVFGLTFVVCKFL